MATQISCGGTLASATGNKSKKFVWTDKMKMSFDQIKLCMATDAILTYPDHNKRFDIYTDASNYQLGACIK